MRLREGCMEFYRDLVERSLEARYIWDRETGKFLFINSAFESLTGYREAEVLGGEVVLLDLVVEEDWDVVRRLDAGDFREEGSCFEFRLRRRDGTLRNVEDYVFHLRLEGRWVRFGSMRDVTNRVKFQRLLTQEIRSELEKSQEVARANVRIYQLTERIQRVPVLTAKILNASDESAVLEETAKFLCDRRGFNFEAATLLLREGDYLEVRYTTRPLKRYRYNIHKSSRYARIYRGEVSLDLSASEGFIVPIQSKDRDIGLLHVHFSPREKLLFDHQDYVRSAQKDLLSTIGNILGLVIENLRLVEKIRQQSVEDQLTKTFNRRYFTQKVKEEFRRAKRYERELCILVIDVDKFKFYNDTYGHLQGDILLSEVAKIFRQNTREQDIICRYGGDEFVILFPETDEESGWMKAERLRRMVERHLFPNIVQREVDIRLSISVGLASARGDVETEKELFKRADEALYEAKRRGRNIVCVYKGEEGDAP